MSALDLIVRESLDKDAAEYCRRSGAQDRQAINAFVRGVKALGLWNSMVCWPLRSSQNAGFGNTVHSLGGLGTYDGTRVNGPVWTADGLVTDAINESVQIPDDANLRNTRSAFFAFKSSDSSFNQRLIHISSAAEFYASLAFDGANFSNITQGYKLNTTRGGALSQNQNGSRLISLGAFRTGAYTADDATDNVFDNGALAVGGARTGLAALNPTGAVASRIIFGNSLAMTGAFAMTSTAKWTDSQVTALHNLYRDTLGVGLGLPNYDPATIEYANRSGATDLANIDAFVRGVKDLGLWNSMVCWPLRSSQNAGTGTTAYSLGGLGTFNGTLTNGPVWNSDGIYTDGVDDSVEASIPESAALTAVAVMKRENNSDSEPRYYWGLVDSAQTGSLNGTTYYLKDSGLGILMFNGSAAWSPARQAINATANFGFQSVAYAESGPSSTSSLNGTFANSSSAPNMSAVRQDKLFLGSRRYEGAGDSEATHAFYAYITTSLQNSTVEALRALYKSTLGTGLGLP